MMVVVGGQARKVGKTRAVCDIIAATRELGWTAVKLTRHEHDPAAARRLTDTDRFLEAGAAAAMLIHSPADLPRAGNLIIESNAVLEYVSPDLIIFVKDSHVQEWKASAHRVFARANLVVEREIYPATLREIADLVSSPGKLPR